MIPENEAQEIFNFDQYVSTDPVHDEGVSIPIQETQVDESFSFDTYLEDRDSQKSDIPRHIARTASRAGETILGFPGDLTSLVLSMGEKIQAPTPEEELTFVQKGASKLVRSIPTSEDIKEFSSFLTEGFTDPQSAQEEFGDEITSLATSLIVPAKNPTKFKTMAKGIGQAIAAKSASTGVEKLGGGAKSQAAAEVGTLFLTSLAGKKFADKFVAEQFADARGKVPRDVIVDTKQLDKSLAKVESELSRGIPTATKTEVQGAISELRAKSATGAMEADELIQAYTDLNERISSKNLFDDLNTSNRKRLSFRYNQVKSVVSKEIAKYGKTNPEFYDQWKEANAAYATIEQSKKVSNFLESKIGKLPKFLQHSVAVELLLGHPVAAAGTVGAAGAVKTGELLARISGSKALRKHYINVIMEAQNENFPAVIKSLNALDAAMKDQ